MNFSQQSLENSKEKKIKNIRYQQTGYLIFSSYIFSTKFCYFALPNELIFLVDAIQSVFVSGRLRFGQGNKIKYHYINLFISLYVYISAI
jgi:hypothetical protein